MDIGVLSMQGDVREHLRMLRRVGAHAVEVKRQAQLEGLAGLIIPGGESTTIGMLMEDYGFLEAIPQRHADGMAVWGTCAGAIILAKHLEPETGQPRLKMMDVTVRRNSYGRQVDSFEEPLDIEAIGPEPFVAVFIRAPWIEEGDWGAVQIMCRQNGHIVMARQDRMLATSFHPEMTDDDRVHRYFVEEICGVR
jgi:5'-phosphate synthase pdxT subunit